MALLQRVGRAGKDGTALAQGRSLPPAWTLVTPYCKRTPPPTPVSFRLLLPPSRSASRRPIWAGARGDNSLVGPGTPPGFETPTATRHYLISLFRFSCMRVCPSDELSNGNK
jgi:hypothetical protein